MNSRVSSRRGVTLVEMLVVVLIVSVVAGVSYPSLVSGLDALRIGEASAQVAAFLSGALNRVDRRQQVIELTIIPKENTLRLVSGDGAFQKELKLSGAFIAAVHPGSDDDPQEARRFYFLPGASAPRIAIELGNKHGSRRVIRIDPITGVPQIQTPSGPVSDETGSLQGKLKASLATLEAVRNSQQHHSAANWSPDREIRGLAFGQSGAVLPDCQSPDREIRSTSVAAFPAGIPGHRANTPVLPFGFAAFFHGFLASGSARHRVTA